jgi:mannose-1-phosphate guanylyltransferase
VNQPIDDFYAVIPAGGIGSRLWPLSRADAPKFLHDLTGSGHSLLRDTWDRLEPLAGPDRIAVVTGRAHRAAVEAELPGIADMNVFLESEPRESAAAIGLAAAILQRRNPDVIIGSFAADHVIRGTRVFEFAVRDAVEVAREGYICTIGISPTEPSIGFGYIKKGPELVVDRAREAALVESFVEKPDLETAKTYLADRSYSWNAGMFIAKASVLLEELQRGHRLRRVKDQLVLGRRPGDVPKQDPTRRPCGRSEWQARRERHLCEGRAGARLCILGKDP